ncbi:cytochrome P450 71D8-like [Corylus avellana]|uniref:cytochrome P450 71D8-like n=1 Tax=Corylus avellana TaxID=13451 RepID=UPI00286C8DC6|nr:cytochrome P450 71D8-like [Corylus avellana]
MAGEEVVRKVKCFTPINLQLKFVEQSLVSILSLMALQYSLAITTFLLLLSLAWLSKLWKRSKVEKLPPGPWKLPIIGNLHNLLGNSLPHHALRDLALKHGPLMHLKLGEVSTLFVSSPRMASELMKTHDLAFVQRPLLLAPKIISNGGTDIAFSPYGEFWRQMRKVCVLELLSAKRVQSFSSIREEEVHNLIDSIHSSSGSVIDLSEHIFTSTTTVLCRAAFGSKCKDQDEFLSLTKKTVAYSGGFELADLYPSHKFVHLISRTKSKLQKIHAKMDKILKNIIREHRENRMSTSSAKTEDLVDVLLGLQQSDKLELPITTNNIKGVIFDIFTGGTDTSSTAVLWAMSEMMRNPRVLEKVQAEIRQAFKGKIKIQEKDLQNLSYLKSVIKETLRLHPPSPLLMPRECREACEIDGYEIPVKTQVFVNAWAIGRDPAYWHDAESFIPERFESSSIDYKGTNFEFIPFGAGRRMCPGILFGIANVELPLAQLLYWFDWELPDKMKPEDLDMTEAFGGVVARKNHLHLIPTSFSSSLAL